MSRALAFAKMRSAYTGMSAAMINFNAAMQKSDDEEADGHLSTLASKVISSISQCEQTYHARIYECLSSYLHI